MNLSEIAKIRLESQHIAGTKFSSPKDIISWMGAVQAQDYAMAKWAMGIRLPGSTEKKVVEALNKGEILRTHLLRPTWHFVSAEDIYWMLELTAPQITASMKFREKWLGLTKAILTKSNRVIEKALTQGEHLTRKELIAELNKANIRTDEYRSGHLLMRAELDGIICSGEERGNKITYALLSERVPQKNYFSNDEALAKLAHKYFSSHCPATIKDFVWWSGLTLSDARKALDLVKSNFIYETFNSETYWLNDSFALPQKNHKSVHLLPAFDEFTISYKNRSASLHSAHYKITFSSNGMFNPLIVIDGQAVGLWKRTFKKDKVIIEIELFKLINKPGKDLIIKAAERFGNFLGKKIEISLIQKNQER
jgi:DNA glycosylase AlkZ-like